MSICSKHLKIRFMLTLEYFDDFGQLSIPMKMFHLKVQVNFLKVDSMKERTKQLSPLDVMIFCQD